MQPSYVNCLPLAILKLLEECAIPYLEVIGLTSHHSANYKQQLIMAKLTIDTLEWAPIGYSQSQARKARHVIPACKGKIRQAIQAYIVKDTVYKGFLEPRTVDKQWTHKDSKLAVGIRRAQYKETGRAMTTTFQEGRHKA